MRGRQSMVKGQPEDLLKILRSLMTTGMLSLKRIKTNQRNKRRRNERISRVYT